MPDETGTETPQPAQTDTKPDASPSPVKPVSKPVGKASSEGKTYVQDAQGNLTFKDPAERASEATSRAANLEGDKGTGR